MEAMKSLHLLSASWRTRKASDVTQSEGLRIEGLMVCVRDWRPRALMSKGKRWICQHRYREQICFSPSLFSLNHQWTGIQGPAVVVRTVFTQTPGSNANVFGRHPHRHTQIHLISLFWAQSSLHVKLIITSPFVFFVFCVLGPHFLLHSAYLILLFLTKM